MNLFQTCAVIASNSAQAAQIKERIEDRVNAGLYPREIEFRVLCDPDRGRVGSGGAAILAAHELSDRLRRGEAVLLINAGGESRRMPSYSIEGKLFAPLPVPSSSLFPPVVLDQQLALFIRYPWNRGELVVSSGDVTIDFDLDALPEDRGEVCGFAKADSFEIGAQHGVFKFDRNRAKVINFYQKESAEFLRGHAALEGSGACALDIGIVGFSSAGVERLMSLAEAQNSDGETFLEILRQGRASLDLYVELIMAFLPGISVGEYGEKVGVHSSLDSETLGAIYTAFRA